MVLKSAVEEHKNYVILFSGYLVVLAIILILLYFHRITAPPPILPPAVGGDSPPASVQATATASQTSIFLTLIYLILGATILITVIGVVIAVYKTITEGEN